MVKEGKFKLIASGTLNPHIKNIATKRQDTRSCTEKANVADRKIKSDKGTISYKNLPKSVPLSQDHDETHSTESTTGNDHNYTRNKHLKNLPFLYPECCSDAYDKTMERRKFKKLNRFRIYQSKAPTMFWYDPPIKTDLLDFKISDDFGEHSLEPESCTKSCCIDAEPSSSSSSNIDPCGILEDCEKSFVKKTCDQLLDLAAQFGLPRVVLPDKVKTKFPPPRRSEPSIPTTIKPKCKTEVPKFLTEIEQYVEREIQRRVIIKDTPIELYVEDTQNKIDTTLNIYKEALASLVQKYPTFRSFLLKTKKAYDAAIEIRELRLKDMEALKLVVLKLQKSVEEQKAAIWNDSQTKITEFRHERIELLKVIDELYDKKESQNCVISELKQELTDNHYRLMDEVDGRRLAIFECSQLNEQLQMLRAVGAKNTETDLSTSEPAEDPIVLRIALQQCREDLASAVAKLSYIQAAYTEVCPLRDFERLEEEHRRLIRESNKLQTKIMILEKELNNVIDYAQRVETEREHLNFRITELEEASTPRLEWQKCAQFIRGGIHRWNLLSYGRSSREKFQIFLKLLALKEDFGPNYYIGKGFGEDVPIYLQYEGNVKNRRFTLRDVRILITDIWKKRRTCEVREKMDVFLAEYFREMYHIPLLQTELAYNLVAGCQRYDYDEPVKLFWGVVEGECQEDIYYSQLKDLTDIHENLKIQMNLLRLTDTVPNSVFCDTIRRVFPLKNEMDVIALLDAATRQLNISIGEEINVKPLFQEFEEGIEQKDFGREVCNQYREERKHYSEEIINGLRSHFSPKDLVADEVEGETEEGPKTLPSVDLSNIMFKIEIVARVIYDVDPNIEDAQMENCLRWIFSVQEATGLEHVQPISYSTLISKLETGNIRRIKKMRPIVEI